MNRVRIDSIECIENMLSSNEDKLSELRHKLAAYKVVNSVLNVMKKSNVTLHDLSVKSGYSTDKLIKMFNDPSKLNIKIITELSVALNMNFDIIYRKNA